jgi:hypothetical protein
LTPRQGISLPEQEPAFWAASLNYLGSEDEKLGIQWRHEREEDPHQQGAQGEGPSERDRQTPVSREADHADEDKP